MDRRREKLILVGLGNLWFLQVKLCNLVHPTSLPSPEVYLETPLAYHRVDRL